MNNKKIGTAAVRGVFLPVIIAWDGKGKKPKINVELNRDVVTGFYDDNNWKLDFGNCEINQNEYEQLQNEMKLALYLYKFVSENYINLKLYEKTNNGYIFYDTLKNIPEFKKYEEEI